jgi:NADPH-dependent glutamate synthase beta subunit-like oxidoreductase
VKIETNKVIGKTFTVDAAAHDMGFDAVFLGVGAGAPSFLGMPGEFAGQVYSANEFLTRVNLMGGDRFPFVDTPVGIGQLGVVVIGAGNTAMDCLRVAQAAGRAHGALRVPPLRGRGAGKSSKSCATRRRKASTSCSCTPGRGARRRRPARARHARGEDGTGRARRARAAASPCPPASSSTWPATP